MLQVPSSANTNPHPEEPRFFARRSLEDGWSETPKTPCRSCTFPAARAVAGPAIRLSALSACCDPASWRASATAPPLVCKHQDWERRSLVERPACTGRSLEAIDTPRISA